MVILNFYNFSRVNNAIYLINRKINERINKINIMNQNDEKFEFTIKEQNEDGLDTLFAQIGVGFVEIHYLLITTQTLLLAQL